MRSIYVTPGLCGLGFLALLACGSSGCASSGAANALAANSTATSGSSSTVVTVSPAFTVSMGDEVAKAAAQLASKVLGGPEALAKLSAEELAARKKKAVDAGVSAGVQEAQKKGEVASEAQKQELATALSKEVDKAVDKPATPSATP